MGSPSLRLGCRIQALHTHNPGSYTRCLPSTRLRWQEFCHHRHPCRFPHHPVRSKGPREGDAVDIKSDRSDNSETATETASPSAGLTNSLTLLPSTQDGVNWYCYTVLGLLFLADLTPIGASLQDSSHAVVTLAAVQWLCFVLPTLWYARSREWDLRHTFRLQPCHPGWLVAGLAAGSALFLAVSYAISLKSGAPFLQPGAGMESSGAGLVSGLVSAPSNGAEWATLLGLVGLSPAVAEELLFRGLLLTSMQQRLGRIDAVSVCAALFALIHMSVPQFFNFAVLGAACGLICSRTDSVFPAISLHLGYNLTGLLLGILLHSVA